MKKMELDSLPDELEDQVSFNGIEILLHEFNGQKWVTVKDLAKSLGYSDTKKLSTLIARNPFEFEGKVQTFFYKNGGQRRQLQFINYHGVIRAAMLSNAPLAIQFRDWAEEVLYKVMTHGYYMLDTLKHQTSLIDKLAGQLSSNLSVIKDMQSRFSQFDKRIAEMEVFVTSPMIRADTICFEPIFMWHTAAQHAKRLLPDKIPPRFNCAGLFDNYAAFAHFCKFHKYPEIRPCGRGPKHEFVYMPCRMTDEFIIETFDKFIKYQADTKEMKKAKSIKKYKQQKESSLNSSVINLFPESGLIDLNNF